MTNKLRSIICAALDIELLTEALAAEIADNLDYEEIAAIIYENHKHYIADEIADIAEATLDLDMHF